MFFCTISLSRLTIVVFFLIFFFWNISHGYVYGLKSADNTVANIKKIIYHYPKAEPDIVSMIRDGRSTKAKNEIIKFSSEYGTSKILHLTLSPDKLSMEEIYRWGFDEQYTDFFKLIKKLGIKVVFRTMHEMNWWWYKRSGNPKQFIVSWKNIWNLSRSAGLDKSQILFDFSVVHQDLPSSGDPTHTSTYIHCTPTLKIQQNCFTMEDYYPWNQYVDIVGVTFYNRGKWRHYRQRLSPAQIMEDHNRSMRSRLKNFHKAIIIDEVWTTAVYYDWFYDPQKSLEVYQTDYNNKNKRLKQLSIRGKSKKEIVWLIYFNVDYTMWYQYDTIGESDRSVIDLRTSKMYTGIYDISKFAEKLQTSKLYKLFSLSSQ